METIKGRKITDKTRALLRYHEAQPAVSCGRLGKFFGLSKQRVSKHIKEDKLDRTVVEYFRTHPSVSPDEVRAIFHITLQRACSLMPAKKGEGRWRNYARG